MTTEGLQLEMKQITLGGETADAAVLAALASQFPKARISHIFASTETGVAFSVTDKKPGFPRAYLDGLSNGVRIRIEDGRLQVWKEISGSSGSAAASPGNGSWIETGDMVKVLGDRVYFLGRVNGIINVGGDKVHPEEVEQVLLDHPAVLGAKVYAKKNPITGAIVAADLVLINSKDDVDAVRNSIREHATLHLKRHQVPAFLRIVKDLHVNSSGKITRIEQ